MLFNRIYDEKDLERYKSEREKKLQEWQARFTEIGVPEPLIDSFARQASERQTPPALLAGLETVHTGFKPEQNFSTSLVTELIQLGLAEIHGDELTLHTRPESLYYDIKRRPGRYCLHCGEKLPDDTSGELARLHIAIEHNGVPSPVESEPSGYVWLTYFECVLDAEQHERFKVKEQ